jgi:flagellar biosynthesis anti-sigma factor FlgM
MRIDKFTQNWIETNPPKLDRQADAGTSRSVGGSNPKPLNDVYRISAISTEGTEFRNARVEELRIQIASGTYEVNADNIAHAMLKMYGR